MKKKTSKILMKAGIVSMCLGLGGVLFNSHQRLMNSYDPVLQLEERVLNVQKELKQNYQLKFINPESDELYRQALEKEYNFLLPKYEQAQPMIKAAHESADVYESSMGGSFGLMALAFPLFAYGVKKSREGED